MGIFDVISVEMNGKDAIKVIISSGPEKPYYIKKIWLISKWMPYKSRYYLSANDHGND